jgi:hypothetical protein
MPPIAKTLLALGAAVAMVLVAVFVRGRLDKREVEQALVLRLVCATELGDLCATAAAADARVRPTVENPADTVRRLAGLGPGDDPKIDAWLTVGPWSEIVDSRPGATPLFPQARRIASSGIVYAFAGTSRNRLACGASPLTACVGTKAGGEFKPMFDDPLSTGVGLTILAQVVMGATNTQQATVGNADVQPGTPGGEVVSNLKRFRPPGPPNIAQLRTAGGALGNPVITTRAALGTVSGIDQAEGIPAVNAVAEVALVDPALGVVLDAVTPAWVDALKKKGWSAPAEEPGLPDGGVLASFQSAWSAA